MATTKNKSPSTAAELRRNAEERLQAKTDGAQPPLGEVEMRRRGHELEVHQIELEMQNAELRGTQDELEMSQNKYAELYDYAPVGYFTFDAYGVVREVNLTGAKLLGVEKRHLIDKPFISFIADADGRTIFSNHLQLVAQRQVMLRCEIGLTGKDGAVIQGQLQSVTAAIGNKAGYILTSIVDGTVRKQLENDLKKAHDNLEVLVRE